VQQPSQSGGLVGAAPDLRLPLHLVDASAGVLQGDHDSFSVMSGSRARGAAAVDSLALFA
jgi:hypothetical protein